MAKTPRGTTTRKAARTPIRHLVLVAALVLVVTMILLKLFSVWLFLWSGQIAPSSVDAANNNVPSDSQVRVDVIQKGSGPPVNRETVYKSMVTLYIEDTATNTKVPSGWSTREEHGNPAGDQPFTFQPGVRLIPGWTEGVLQLHVGDRAWLHVPASLGYGAQSVGKPGGAFYVPPNSDLLFDIEILSAVENKE